MRESKYMTEKMDEDRTTICSSEFAHDPCRHVRIRMYSDKITCGLLRHTDSAAAGG